MELQQLVERSYEALINWINTADYTLKENWETLGLFIRKFDKQLLQDIILPKVTIKVLVRMSIIIANVVKYFRDIDENIDSTKNELSDGDYLKVADGAKIAIERGSLFGNEFINRNIDVSEITLNENGELYLITKEIYMTELLTSGNEYLATNSK